MTEQEINKTIATNLRIIRENTFRHKNSYKKIRRKKITQKETAKVLNVTFQQIQKYELGKNEISSAKLKILADFFQVPIQDIYSPIEDYTKELPDEAII